MPPLHMNRYVVEEDDPDDTAPAVEHGHATNAEIVADRCGRRYNNKALSHNIVDLPRLHSQSGTCSIANYGETVGHIVDLNQSPLRHSARLWGRRRRQ
jgi:hypothetical protein